MRRSIHPMYTQTSNGVFDVNRRRRLRRRGSAGRPRRGRMGPCPLYRDEAIVLRTHKLGEADRIITMLTRTRGRVRAVAKGVRRTKSRFGARLEPGMVVDVQCYEGATSTR